MPTAGTDGVGKALSSFPDVGSPRDVVDVSRITVPSSCSVAGVVPGAAAAGAEGLNRAFRNDRH